MATAAPHNQGHAPTCWAFCAATTLRAVLKTKLPACPPIEHEKITAGLVKKFGAAPTHVGKALDYLIAHYKLPLIRRHCTYKDVEAVLRDNRCVAATMQMTQQEWQEFKTLNVAIPEAAKVATEAASGLAAVGGITAHAVVIISAVNDGPNGAYYWLKNSWGDAWGVRGHCRVSKSATKNWIFDELLVDPDAVILRPEQFDKLLVMSPAELRQRVQSSPFCPEWSAMEKRFKWEATFPPDGSHSAILAALLRRSGRNVIEWVRGYDSKLEMELGRLRQELQQMREQVGVVSLQRQASHERHKKEVAALTAKHRSEVAELKSICRALARNEDAQAGEHVPLAPKRHPHGAAILHPGCLRRRAPAGVAGHDPKCLCLSCQNKKAAPRI
jgi:hypothetical protein